MDEKATLSRAMTLDEFLAEWRSESSRITVHTSGSTGKPKVMSVEKSRMEASARITCSFLGLGAADTALLCMPLDYIAGKMVVVRSLVGGMRLISVHPSSHPLLALQKAPTFAAMVPMQVFCSMQSEHELRLLRGIRNLIIGGGAVDAGLAARLRSFPNAVWSTYGMTETLSHIALRRLSGIGASDYYTPFSGVALSVDDEGCLIIDAPAVCAQRLMTNDIVEFHPDGRRFRIVGRRDNVIDSGGVKIHAEQVEERLRGRLSCDFAVTRRPHPQYGEIVVLLVALADGAGRNAALCRIKEICGEVLPKYWQPKEIHSAPSIPYTETGKIARMEVQKLVEEGRTMVL